MFVILSILLLYFTNFVESQDENTSVPKYPYHALVSVELTQNGLDFLTNAIEHQMDSKVNQLKIPDVSHNVDQIGLTASVTNITIHPFVPPRVSVNLQDESMARVVLNGGHFKACAHLSTNSMFANGQVCAGVEQNEHLSASVSVNPTFTEDSQLKLSTGKCNVMVPLYMKLPFSTPINLLLSPLRIWAETWIRNYINDTVCNLIKENIEWAIDQTVLNITEEYGLQYNLHGFKVSQSSLTVQLEANFTKAGHVADKRTDNDKLTKLELDNEKIRLDKKDSSKFEEPFTDWYSLQ